MKIETKYDLNDRVFYMKNNRVEEDTICAIHFEYISNFYRLPRYTYRLPFKEDVYAEEQLYPSREELLKSL